MYNHAPNEYICPICLASKGIEDENTLIKQDDIVFQNGDIMAFISSFLIKNNPGHVIIIPRKHYENLYEIDNSILVQINLLAKTIAIALKSIRTCDGITIIQNNEPAGDQHAFHYHLHVFPRFYNDKFHHYLTQSKVILPSEQRKKFALELQKYLQE